VTTRPVLRLSACTSITTRSVLSLILSGRIISCRVGFWAEQTMARAVLSSASRHSDLNLDLSMFQSRPQSPARRTGHFRANGAQAGDEQEQHQSFGIAEIVIRK